MCKDTISASAAVAVSVILFVVALIVAAGAYIVGRIPVEDPKRPELKEDTAAVYLIEDPGPPSMNAGVSDPYADANDQAAGDAE